ncbi:MAG: signal peptide peptidase SppA [Polyangiaceae bacterium]
MLSMLTTLVRNLCALLVFPLFLLRRFRATPAGGWVHLEIEGQVVEIATPRSRLAQSFGSQQEQGLSLHGIRTLIDELIDDPRVAGLAVSIQRLEAPAATRTAIRAQLARLRAAGKRVLVHLPRGGSSGELLIASAADTIAMGIRTSLGPLGFKMGGTYVRGTLDRLGIVPEVLAQGTYKTAGEPLMRESMSDPQKEQLGRLLDELEHELLTGLVEGRRVSLEVARGWVDRGLIDAEDALSLGLVDELVHDDELKARLGALTLAANASPPAKAKPSGATPVVPADATTARQQDDDEAQASLVTPAVAYLTRRRSQLWKPLRPARKIAIIQVQGAIVEKGMPSMGASADDATLVKLLETAREHPRVAGVVLQVNSPGGGVLASEKIYRAVTRVADKKPTIACFGGVAASGGYYVSAPCHAIVAQPTTITGSIGVVAFRAAIGPFLERLGVVSEVLTRGEHADLMTLARPLRDDEKHILEHHLETAYREFVGLVAQGRKRTPDEIYGVAGGRVWTGRDALERGLVDSLGGLDEAIAQVRRRVGDTKTLEPVLLSPPKSPIESLRSMFGLATVGATAAPSWLASLWTRTPTSLKHLGQIALGTRDPVLVMWTGDELLSTAKAPAFAGAFHTGSACFGWIAEDDRAVAALGVSNAITEIGQLFIDIDHIALDREVRALVVSATVESYPATAKQGRTTDFSPG